MANLVDPFQVSWILGAVIGMLASFRNLQDAAIDARVATARGATPATLLVARTAVRRELVRFGTHLLIFVIGIVLLVRPLLETEGLPPRGIQLLLDLVVTATIASMMAVSILDRRDRRRLLRLLVRQAHPTG